MSKELDLTGTIHGEFTVVNKSDKYFVGVNGKKHGMWNCRCNKCGAIEAIQTRYIRKGQHKFCDTCYENLPDVKARRAQVLEELNRRLREAGRPEKTPEEFKEIYNEFRHAMYTNRVPNIQI